jgi:hypothetical protein
MTQIAGALLGAAVVIGGGFMGARMAYTRKANIVIGQIIGAAVAFAVLCLVCLAIWLMEV